MKNKIIITISIDQETIVAMDDLKETTKLSRSKLIRYLFHFFGKYPEQLTKIIKWSEVHERIQDHSP